jgi:hypothetical protein
MLTLKLKTMKHLFELILISFFLFNVQPTDAQILKKLKKKIVKTVEKEIDETIDGKAKKESEKKAETPKQKSPQEIEKGLEKQQFEGGITLTAPNSNLQSIKLQEYKGLPRIGVLNSYGASRQGVTVFSTLDKEIRSSYHYYNLLLEMKLLNDYYEKMDTDYSFELGVNNSDKDPEDEKKSIIVQKHLKKIAHELTTDEAYIRYFCKNKETCYQWKKRRSTQWGGSREDEFAIHNKFTSFVNDNFQDLQKWAARVNNEAYLVKTIDFEDYDFEKEGFPVKLSLSSLNVGYNPSSALFVGSYKPVASMDKSYYNYINFLINLPPENAEEFIKQNNKRTLLAVFKISYYKIETEGSRGRELLDFNNFSGIFHLTSPVVKIYQDEALTVKVAEVNVSAQTDSKQDSSKFNNNTTTIVSVPVCSKEETPDLMYVDQPPIFYGCDVSQSKSQIKQCFLSKITEHFKNKFNKDIGQGLGGGRVRFAFRVTIDVNGQLQLEHSGITSNEARRELDRIGLLLPKIIPAKHRGKKVCVTAKIFIQIK